MKLTVVLLLISAVCLGCAAQSRSRSASPANATAATPRAQQISAKAAQVYMPGASRKRSFDVLANRLSNSGWRVASVNDYQLTFETDAKGAAGFITNMMYGSGRQPIYRLISSGSEDPSGTTLGADLFIISHPGTAREQVAELKGGKWTQQVQAILDAARGDLLASTGATGAPR